MTVLKILSGLMGLLLMVALPSSAQDCCTDKNTGLRKPKAITAMIAATGKIGWTVEDCALKSAQKSDSIEGTVPPTDYELVAGVCLDTRCAKVDPAMSERIKSVLAEAKACFLRLGAARSAALLERLLHVDAEFLKYFSETEQNWLSADKEKKSARSATLDEREADVAERAQPLRINCYPMGTSFTHYRLTNGINLGQIVTVRPTFGEGAAASSPGMPLWPSIDIHPLGYALNARNPESAKSIVLHELMHTLGYEHEKGVGDDEVKTLPYFSACQLCCFPDGMKDEQRWNGACAARGKRSLYRLACDICGGKLSLADFAKVKDSYAARVDRCYKIGNPL